MPVCYALLGLGAAALAAYLREKFKGASLKEVFLKTTVSLLFVALAVCASAHTMSPTNALVILGLVCGLLGDVWLDLKYVFPERDAAFTYAGFAAFGLGHVLYIAGMLTRFAPDRASAVAVPILLGLLCGAVTVAMEKPMKLRFGEMKPAVAAYGTLLFSMMWTAGSLALVHAWREPMLNLMFASGVLFAVSDLVLSRTYFGEGKDRQVDLAANYLTYYPAQYLIAYALLFLRA